MKLQVQFAGYEPVDVDTEFASCGVFEGMNAMQARDLLEQTIMGDADENGWVAGTSPEGEDFQVRLPASYQTIDDVVAKLTKRFPDADPGPAGLWGFVNAGWEGPVDADGIDDWAAAWEEAQQDIEV